MNREETDKLFSSFFWAGYECTSAKTEKNFRLDMLSATKHDEYVKEDYQLLGELNIKTAREGFSWSRIDLGNNNYDFSRYVPILKAGQDLKIQQVWDLNHFDYPDRLNPYSEEFVSAFINYSFNAYKTLREYIKETLFIVPINEISFFAWIGADKGGWAPFKHGRKNGQEFKKQLVRAALGSMRELWKMDQNIRFIQVDPFMRRLDRPPVTKRSQKHVSEFNKVVRYEAWDMISGVSCPELGGDPKYLDIIGINYYIHNQEWVSGIGNSLKFERISWTHNDRVPVGSLLQEIYDKYGKPMVITETGSFSENREMWWERIMQETIEAKKTLPILGLCAYPILDRPDSTNFLVAKSGFWDFDQKDAKLERIPNMPTIQMVKRHLSNLY
jgi:beta-glucosidase/6-phospho-beta-glucosidase/beta-galactosidase